MRYLRFLIHSIILLSFDVAIADSVISNTEHYAKCYAKLTDHPVELDSPDYLAVQAGTLTPVAACMKAFNKALFTTSGNTRKLTNVNDTISLSIVRNFHAFHLSWFTSNSGDIGASPFVDMNEPGLYLTDALFSKKHFKTVVTASEPLRGLRSAGVPDVYHINGSNLTGRQYIVGPVGSGKPNVDDFALLPDTNRVQLGALIGISRAPAQITSLPVNLVGTPPLTNAQQAQHRLETKNYNMTTHHGGGILGSAAGFYINDETRRPLNGGLLVHRRWANNTFYDLMCSTLPNLKETDAVVVAEFNQFKDSQLAFRQNKTCLSCHVTLDNFAHAARHVETRTLTAGTYTRLVRDKYPTLNALAYQLVFASPETQPAGPLLDADPLYHRRPAAGKLVYRDFNGKLVNEKVTGLEELGQKVSQQDDIYMCAAKRYYSFLTGVDVSMAPVPVDATTKKPKDSDKFDYYHRQIVLGLSKRLKTGGSLSTLVQDILNTQAFKARNPATVGEN